MTDIQKTLLIALGLLMIVCAIVGAVVRRQIGGFFETVAREEREAEEAREREAREAAADPVADQEAEGREDDKNTQEQSL